MEKIVLQRKPLEKKNKRSAVVIQPTTYMKVYELAHEVNMPIEGLVDLLLTKALEAVEVTDAE